MSLQGSDIALMSDLPSVISMTIGVPETEENMGSTLPRVAYYVLFKSFLWRYADRDLEFGDFVIRIAQKREWKNWQERKRRYYQIRVEIRDCRLGRTPTEEDLAGDNSYAFAGGYFMECLASGGGAVWYPDTLHWLMDGAHRITACRRRGPEAAVRYQFATGRRGR